MSSRFLTALLAAGLAGAPLGAAFAQGATATSPPAPSSSGQQPQPPNSLPPGAATGSSGPDVNTSSDQNVATPAPLRGGSAEHRLHQSTKSHTARRGGGGYSPGSKLQNPANAGVGSNGGSH